MGLRVCKAVPKSRRLWLRGEWQRHHKHDERAFSISIPFSKLKLILSRMISIRSTAKGASYLCYLISSTHPNHKQRTYVGVKNDTHRRLRQHNREIIGGAKSTNIGRPWDVWMIIEGFPNQSTCLKFEWMWKHMKPRSSHCKKARITKLRNLLCKEQCTRNSPLAKTMPLTVTVFDRFNESDCNNARKYG